MMLMPIAGNPANETSGVFSLIIAPSGSGNERNSEADILPLQDGSLLVAWSDYYSNNSSDWGLARISAMISRDGGRSWGKKFIFQENIAKLSVAQPSFLRLPSGKVLFFFVFENSNADTCPMLRVSRDDTKTFSPPKRIPVDPSPAYAGINNDRAILLKSGRILLPVWYTKNYDVSTRILSRVYYSDDEGETWKPSRTIVDIPASKARGADEPGVVELKDGRVMMWNRTELGSIYRCYSNDKGETWSKAESMNLLDPNAPQSMKRIPSTGDLLLVWNKSREGRYPLTLAISGDDGKTWEHVKNLDDEPGQTYAYTSIEFVQDRVLFTYYVARPASKDNPWVKKYPGLNTESLKLKSVPVGWLYQ